MLDPRWLASQLLERKLVTQEQLRTAQARDPDDLSLGLVSTGALSEADLLRTLGLLFRTRYVTAEKLGQAQIPRSVLEVLSPTECERVFAVPVRWDAKSKTLSVVAADPGLTSLAAHLEQVTHAANIEVYVGLAAAVRAAIRKWYKGDIHAFSRVERSLDKGYPQMLDMYDQRAIDLEEPPPAAAAAPAPAAPVAPSRRDAAVQASKGASPVPAADASGAAGFFEMTGLLVGLLELPDGWRQGHANEVTRLAVGIAERIGLTGPSLDAVRCAAQLHDLGKPALPHLTALTLHRDRSLRRIAVKVHELPRALFGQISLPVGTLEILDALYERPDGSGVPGRVQGESFPISSRILAVADAFFDLIRNSATPTGRCNTSDAAVDLLREAATEGALDGHLVELLPEVLAAPNAFPILGRSNVLVVDSNVEDTTLLEYRLVSHGFDVRIARTTAAGARLALAEQFDLVLCEIEAAPVDGFDFVKRLRSDPRTKRVPVIFTSSRDGDLERQRAKEVGVHYFMTKPLDLAEVVTKARMLALRAGAA